MRMTQRSCGLVSGQIYEDRTCEVIFAGLDEATDIDAVQTFVAQTKTIVYEIETMLAGIKLVMSQSLGNSFNFYFILPLFS